MISVWVLAVDNKKSPNYLISQSTAEMNGWIEGSQMAGTHLFPIPAFVSGALVTHARRVTMIPGVPHRPTAQ